MENLSHSLQPNMLSKKSCNGNANKSIYHDVFGGPPKFGAPTLSPRVDDYNEIFGGFHTSRASSIPVLDLPLVDEAAEVFLDVRSPGFDYGEVFGGFNSHEFGVSYEELLKMEQSNGYSDSSDEAWTPAEAENLSEASDHSAKDQYLSNGDLFESTDGGMEFNVSYDKAGQRSVEDLPNGITHMTQLHDVSGYTFVVDKTASLPNTDYKYEHLLESDDHFDIDYSGEMMRGRRLRKVMSHSANGSTDGLLFGNDFKPHKEFVRNGSLPNEMFVTVSDVSLKTRPSHLPPPFRPPPAVDPKKGGCVKANPNCKSVASEEIAGDSSPPYFDVEVDASSPAAASAAAMKEAMEKAQVKLKSAKESMERKREGFQTRAKSGSENDRKDKEEKVSKIVNGSGSRKDERGQGISHREENGMEFFILEEKQKVQMTNQLMSDSLEGKKHLYAAKKSAEENHGRESMSSQGSDTIDGAGEWKEATQFFELVTNKSRKAFDRENNEKVLMHDSDFHEHGKKEKKATVETLQQLQENAKKVKVVRADQELKEYEKKSKVSKETFERAKSSGRSEVSNRQKGLHKKVQLAQNVSRQEGNEEKFKIDLKPVDTEEQTRADELQIHENYVEIQQKGHSFAARQTLLKEKVLQPSEDIRSMQDVKQFTHEKGDRERRQRRAFELEENEKKLNDTLEPRESERRLKKALGQEEKQKMVKAVCEQEENEMLRGSHETGEKEKRLREALQREENERRLKEALETEENERQLKEMLEREERLRRKREAAEQEEKEKKQREACEREENEKRQREAREREENEKRLKEAMEKEENERRLKETLEKEELQRRQREASEQEENAKREREAYEREENEKRLKEVLEKEEKERRLKVDVEQEENEKRLKEAHEREENEKKQREAREKEESEKRCKEHFERDEIEQGIKEAYVREVGKGLEEVCEPQENCMASREAQEEDQESEEIGDAFQVACKREVTETKHMDSVESGKKKVINKGGEDHSVSNQWCKLDDDKNPGATQLIGTQEGGSEKLEAAKEIDHEETNKRFTVQRNFEKEVASGIAQGTLEHEKSRFVMENVTCTEQKTIGNVRSTFQVDSDVGNQGKKFAHERNERGKNIEQAQSSLNQENNKDEFRSARAVKESVEMGKKLEGAQPAVLEVIGSAQRTSQQVNSSQSSERKVKSSYETLSSEDREAERMKRERDLEMERLRKIEEEREREREREKDRMAVDGTILETREKAYAEARERAERAAVERVTAEARQRALNEARERLEKACAEAREKSFPDKTSTEARLRAERAAVERATAEARERAFEKAMAERANFEARERIERSVSDKFSVSSRNSGMRPSSSSSDLQDMQAQGNGSFSGLRYQYSSVYGETFEGVEGESAQRCKARLERYQRTAERAAKALAEKNMRDLLAQREQAERNRLAETLDADVKRWSSGKEGNLRALLSTLQYILGPDSGWQPIPLTEVITSAAVKKAYRKATLCVHPDKLQQRGASIQQKYICEKVFDLLKEAWNKFNSEER